MYRALRVGVSYTGLPKPGVRCLCTQSNTPGPLGPYERFWRWTAQERPSWKKSPVEAAVAFVVFGITGSTSVALVRPGLKKVGMEGSLKDGPWSYRIGSLLIVSPIYSVVLITVGSLAGRHVFFARMSYKIMGRFVPNFAMSRLQASFASLFPIAAKCGTWGR